MAAIYLKQSEGAGEVFGGWDYTAGYAFSYWPLPASGYEFIYALIKGVKIDVLPLKLITEADPFTIEVFYSKSIITPLPTPPSIPDKPGLPFDPPTGEYVNGNIGTRCDLMGKRVFNRNWYTYRDRYTNAYHHWSNDASEAKAAGNKDKSCFLPIPPTPATWEDGIEQSIKSAFDGLINYAKDSINTVETRITSIIGSVEAIKQGLVGIIKRIEDIELITVALDIWFVTMFNGMRDRVVEWIVTAFIEIMEKVLEMEAK